LAAKKLISSASLPVKILGKKEKLTVKVKFAGIKMSVGAQEQTK
jgi:hypothetical protein